MQEPIIWGAILGVQDGLNPCMMLIFLSMAAYSISITKNFPQLCLAFICMSYLVYLLALYGILSALTVIEYFLELKLILICIILGFGGLMLKEGVLPGKWIKLGIPASAKPEIQRLVARSDLAGACTLAGLTSLYELPCSLGLPLAYIRLLREFGIQGISRLGFLAFYNLMYILPLICLALLILLGAKLSQLEAWRMEARRYLRGISGCSLIGLGVWIGLR